MLQQLARVVSDVVRHRDLGLHCFSNNYAVSTADVIHGVFNFKVRNFEMHVVRCISMKLGSYFIGSR